MIETSRQDACLVRDVAHGGLAVATGGEQTGRDGEQFGAPTDPVALPATFTLASALGARALAKLGVLPTRLSAVDEAASMDVLCADKTGTLTQNELTVTSVHPLSGFDEAHVLALAAMASSDGGQDPVDGAIRAAAVGEGCKAAVAATVEVDETCAPSNSLRNNMA